MQPFSFVCLIVVFLRVFLSTLYKRYHYVNARGVVISMLGNYQWWWMVLVEDIYGGTERNRTAVRGVAVPCMTTLPPRLKHLIYRFHSYKSTLYIFYVDDKLWRSGFTRLSQ